MVENQNLCEILILCLCCLAVAQGCSAAVQGCSAAVQGFSPAVQSCLAAVQGFSPAVQGYLCPIHLAELGWDTNNPGWQPKNP